MSDTDKEGDSASSNWGCAMCLTALIVCVTAYAIVRLIVTGVP